jgi:hypothetical protein
MADDTSALVSAMRPEYHPSVYQMGGGTVELKNPQRAFYAGVFRSRERLISWCRIT